MKTQYFVGGKLAFETVEAPLFHEPFGSEPHKDFIAAPYRVVWEGFITVPLTDRYSFSALLGQNEKITVSIDGREVLVLGVAKPVAERTELTAARRHALRIEKSLQEVDGLPLDKQVELEDANIASSLKYAREKLGM